MEQIKDIINENDIAAFIVLHDESQHSEFYTKIDPSYSAAKIEHNGVRLRLKQSEMSEDEYLRKANGTYNMFVHLDTVTQYHQRMFSELKNILQDKLGGEEGAGGGFTGHDQQFN